MNNIIKSLKHRDDIEVREVDGDIIINKNITSSFGNKLDSIYIEEMYGEYYLTDRGAFLNARLCRYNELSDKARDEITETLREHNMIIEGKRVLSRIAEENIEDDVENFYAMLDYIDRIMLKG